jgi:hypothetical protein
MNTTKTRTVLAAITVAFSAACATNPPVPDPGDVRVEGVTVSTTASSYTPGSRVGLTITNNSGSTLGYNACTRTLEHETNGNWNAIPEPNRMCTMQITLIEPGRTRSDATDLPNSMPAGTYRMVISMSRQEPGAGGTIMARSNSFTVR